MRWFPILIGGQRWIVDILSFKHKVFDDARSEPGQKIYGLTIWDACRIVVAREQESESAYDTLVHELEHAIRRVSGSCSMLSDACEGSDLADDLEERMIRSEVPIRHRLLKDLFKATFPKWPGRA